MEVPLVQHVEFAGRITRGLRHNFEKYAVNSSRSILGSMCKGFANVRRRYFGPRVQYDIGRCFSATAK
jgi:hypothetical protein